MITYPPGPIRVFEEYLSVDSGSIGDCGTDLNCFLSHIMARNLPVGVEPDYVIATHTGLE